VRESRFQRRVEAAVFFFPSSSSPSPPSPPPPSCRRGDHPGGQDGRSCKGARRDHPSFFFFFFPLLHFRGLQLAEGGGSSVPGRSSGTGPRQAAFFLSSLPFLFRGRTRSRSDAARAVQRLEPVLDRVHADEPFFPPLFFSLPLPCWRRPGENQAAGGSGRAVAWLFEVE